jgi:hypothetical protein
LADDAHTFPALVVKDTKAFLAQQHQSFVDKPPTPQILDLSTKSMDSMNQVRFKTKLAPERIETVHFEIGTAEILLRHKPTKLILCAYHYVVARNIFDGRVILGGFLRREQRQRLL